MHEKVLFLNISFIINQLRTLKDSSFIVIKQSNELLQIMLTIYLYRRMLSSSSKMRKNQEQFFFNCKSPFYASERLTPKNRRNLTVPLSMKINFSA